MADDLLRAAGGSWPRRPSDVGRVSAGDDGEGEEGREGRVVGGERQEATDMSHRVRNVTGLKRTGSRISIRRLFGDQMSIGLQKSAVSHMDALREMSYVA